MIELTHFQVLSGVLFAIGLYGVLARRNAILVLMSIELMLNAVNINLIGYSIFMNASESHRALGHVLIIFRRAFLMQGFHYIQNLSHLREP